MRRFLRIIITVLALSSITIIGLQYLQFQQNSAASDDNPENRIQEETTAALGDLLVTVSATGLLMPARQAPLLFELSGPVREVLVEVGQTVKAGDTLARLDVSDLEAALVNAEITLQAQQAAYAALTTPAREVDIAAAQAAVAAANAQAGAASLGADASQTEIARLQAEIARNQLWQAQLQRDAGAANVQQLLDQASAAGINLAPFIPAPPNPADNVTAQIRQAEYGIQLADTQAQGVINQPSDIAALSAANAQLVAAQTQLDRLLNGASPIQLQIAATQLQIAQLAVEQARTTLNRAVLAAPFDGIIAQNNLMVGEVPPADQPAFQLIDSTGYYIDLAVDETDIVEIQVGQQVSLAFDALPETEIRAIVSRVAVTPTRLGQLVTYTVRVTLDPTDTPARIGMTATATIIVNELKNILTLPNRFIRIDRTTQQPYVTLRREDNTFDEVAVELGARNETNSQIANGLEAGQRVVLLPRGTLNPIG